MVKRIASLPFKIINIGRTHFTRPSYKFKQEQMLTTLKLEPPPHTHTHIRPSYEFKQGQMLTTLKLEPPPPPTHTHTHTHIRPSYKFKQGQMLTTLKLESPPPHTHTFVHLINSNKSKCLPR